MTRTVLCMYNLRESQEKRSSAVESRHNLCKTLVCLWTFVSSKDPPFQRCLFYNIRWSFGRDSPTDSATLLVCNLLLEITPNMFTRPQFKVQKLLFACVTCFTATEKINQLPGENKLKASPRVDCRNTPVADSSVEQERFVAVTY